ncbi:MAG: hypothetical protein WBM43_07755 [Flavobacteriaceae bacterium]
MHLFRLCSVTLFILCLSCSSSNDPLEIDRWQLSSTFSYMTNTELSASELSYTETVEFVSDGLFLKSQTRAGETTIAEARWEVTEIDGQSGFQVRYTENNPLIENCSGEAMEFYILQAGMLIQNNAIPCDGPEYRYIRRSE